MALLLITSDQRDKMKNNYSVHKPLSFLMLIFKFILLSFFFSVSFFFPGQVSFISVLMLLFMYILLSFYLSRSFDMSFFLFLFLFIILNLYHSIISLSVLRYVIHFYPVISLSVVHNYILSISPKI